MVDESEIYRALGRIEGSQEQILERIDKFEKAFGLHCEDDAAQFKRNELDQQKLSFQDENVKTLGKYILAVLGTLFSLVGTAVVAYFTGHVTFHK